MSNSGLRRRRSHLKPAFTLAELLIVIAIIAVLISILLPSLAAARRSANSVKCLSSLKQIGQALLMYAQDNQRAFPVVYWNPGPGYNASGTAAQKPWQDFLVKYLQKADPTVMTAPGPTTCSDILKFRSNSTIWGCPAYNSDSWASLTAAPATNAPNVFNSGYGMSKYALAPYNNGGASGPAVKVGVQRTGLGVGDGNLAIVNYQNAPIIPQWGSFMKMEQWGRKGADKGIIADSNTFDIPLIGSSMIRSQATFQPMTFVAGGANHVDVDGVRHLSPASLVGASAASGGPTYTKVKGSRGINMLFVDGHAAAVNPIEAWVALRGGGYDFSTP